MKKRIISLVLTLAVLLSASALAGCGEKKPEAETPAKEFAFANFEQWGPDFQLMRLINKFGVVTRNSDPKYVHSGKYSAKLNPMGGYIRYSEPILYLPTVSSHFGYAYNDFTYYEEINAQLYNAEDKELEVIFGLVATINSKTEITIADGETYKLKPGEWTRIDYWIDHAFLSLSTNVNDIKGIYFKFANAGVEKQEDAPTVYLDDINFRKADGQVQVENLVKLDNAGKDVKEQMYLPVYDENGKVKLDEKGKPVYEWVEKDVTKYEILDFEDDWQKYALTANRKDLPENTFEYELARSEEGGVQATSGSNMLKITRHNGSALSSSALIIPEKVMKSTVLSSIPEEDWANTYICFDMYADYSAIWQYMLINPYFCYEGGKDWMSPVRASTGKSWAHGLDLTKGVWKTYQVPLTELTKDFKEHVTKPGQMEIQLAQVTDGNDYVLYLDNLRILKVKG